MRSTKVYPPRMHYNIPGCRTLKKDRFNWFAILQPMLPSEIRHRICGGYIPVLHV